MSIDERPATGAASFGAASSGAPERGEQASGPSEPAGGRRPWYRRTRVVVAVAIGVVALAGCGAVLAFLFAGRGAEEVPVDEAVREFREGDGGEGPAAAEFSPAAGVYAFDADGSGQLSLLATAQPWGATVPATVTRDGRCWTLHVDYSTNHTQGWDFCPEGPVLTELGGRTFQRYDFVAFTVDDETVFTCDPPGEVLRAEAKAGESWAQSCAGGSTSRDSQTVSAGTNTFVGEEDVVVGAEEVATYHYRQQRTISGDQDGRETTDIWFAQADALIVKMQRDVDVKSPSPIGDVHYVEQGTLVLQSLSPQR